MCAVYMLVAEIDISNPKFVHLIIKLLHSSGVMCVGVCCAGPMPMGPGDGMPPTEPKHRAEKEEGAAAGNEPPKSKVKASLFLSVLSEKVTFSPSLSLPFWLYHFMSRVTISDCSNLGMTSPFFFEPPFSLACGTALA